LGPPCAYGGGERGRLQAASVMRQLPWHRGTPTESSTPEVRLAKRCALAADRAQTESVHTEHRPQRCHVHDVSVGDGWRAQVTVRSAMPRESLLLRVPLATVA